MLRVSVLGELRLEVDGGVRPPPASLRARSLLGWLALNPGVHSRAALAPRFWPEVLDASARASLRNSLWAVRHALGDVGSAYLVAGRDTLGLGEDVWVDARAFTTLVAAGRDEEALALCHGRLLEDVDDDWVLEARDAHRDEVGSLLERLSGAAEQAGDRKRALDLTRRWTALDPLAEPAQRELIRRLAAAGDRSGAMAVYRRLSDRLRVELQMAPQAETRALVARLRDPAPEPPAADPAIVLVDEPPRPAALPPRLAAAPPSAFVGRDRELMELRRELTQAEQQEAPRIAVVGGDPGIGKSRLARELAASLHQQAVHVLHGTAREDGEPLGPFAEALGGHLEAPEAEHRAGAAVQVHARSERAVAHLRWLTASAPVLLVLDDLQWADGPTGRLLGFILASRPLGRLLVLATYRERELPLDHPVSAALVAAQREGQLRRLDLAGLDAAAVEALAGGDAALGSQVHADSEGNPLFALELLRARASGDQSLPRGVKDVVARRITTLPEDVRRLLEVAAVLGREFDLQLLEALLGGDEEQFLDSLDAALAAGILQEAPGSAERCGFTHALIRETLLDVMSRARIRRLHLAAADRLEDGAAPGDDARSVEIAQHLAAAGRGADPERLVGSALRAGTWLRAQQAYDEEAGLYGRVLDGLPPDAGALQRRVKAQRMFALQALAHLVLDGGQLRQR